MPGSERERQRERERRPLLGAGSSSSSTGYAYGPSSGASLASKSAATAVQYTPAKLRQINTFDLIHRVRKDVETLCDSPISNAQLESPKLIFLLSPLLERYSKLNNVALVWCLLVCRIHFLGFGKQASPSAYSLAHSRAAICEILSTRIIRRIWDEDPSDETMLHLAHCLNASFSPFQGAPQDILDYHEKVDPMDNILTYPKSNALELAIISNAKRLIKAMPTQRVIDAIWTGQIIYSPTSFIDLLPDHYKRKPISLYDQQNAPLLNQHRLIVPRIRALLEYGQFLVLFASYIAVVFTMEPERINGWEIWLVIYASGFALDKFATVLEHGMGVYVRNMWNSIDLGFCAIFALYLILRIMDVSQTSPFYYAESLNVLACGAIILFPRLAFMVMSNNALVLGLRAMFVKFVFLVGLAVWCFAGFLLAFYLLSNGRYSAGEIGKFMIWTTFGMDGTAIGESRRFHPYIGPALWTAYAFLSSTLLLSTMISILSVSFRSIAEDSTAEVMFKKAVDTLEGIKSDAIFLYQPPLNIPAFLVLFPLRFCVSPRWFHKLNVYAARVLNAPILLMIGVWERRRTIFGNNGRLPIYLLARRFLNATTARHDLHMVFELPPELEDELPQNGVIAGIESDEEEGRRGRSPSPKRGRMSRTEQLRSGSRPSPLTRLYGRGGSSAEDVELLSRKIDRLEELLSRLEDAVKVTGADG